MKERLRRTHTKTPEHRSPKAKKDLKGTKLDDNKAIAGKGRPSDPAIDTLETLDGLAIR